MRFKQKYIDIKKGIVVSNGEAIVAALKETMRYSLFLGTFDLRRKGIVVSNGKAIALADHNRHVLGYAIEAIIDNSIIISLNTQFQLDRKEEEEKRALMGEIEECVNPDKSEQQK
ncbi:hypothetical protein JHK87_055749 [Glycine soja]|nr:hypothetical protein JHK87_055749 [Glycine soja]